MEICGRDGCERGVVVMGLCKSHYAVDYRRRRRAESAEDRGDVVCDKCGAAYRPIRYRQGRHFCPDCRAGRSTRPRPDLTCAWCGLVYQPVKYRWDHETHFCSRQCKTRHGNDKKNTPEGRAAKNNARNLRAYGLTTAQVQKLRDAGCSICGAKAGEKSGRWGGQLHVDHDHATGVVRGVLCHGCNVSIGHFGDNPKLLRAAARYLEK